MSLWIPRRNQSGQLFYILVEVPLPLLVLAFALTLAILLGNLAAAPIQTLLCCFAEAAAGSVLIGVAKWSMVRQGILVSFGSARMSKRMRVLYRIGWLLVMIGTVLTLFAVVIVLRH